MTKTDPSTAPPANVRYARQISLKEWGDAGQAKVQAARVLVVGLGGLGAPIVTYLAGAGVGQLTLNDFDTVDASNLPRQSLYREQDVGRRKAAAARDFVAQRNSDVDVRTLDRRLSAVELVQCVGQHDVVIDGCDNFATRFAINAASVAAGVPLVSAAAIRHEGQVAVFDPRDESSACYACLYQEDDATEGDCAGQGVFTPLVGVVGSLAAAAALRLIVYGRAADHSTLQCIDGAGAHFRSIRIPRDPCCRVCAESARTGSA